MDILDLRDLAEELDELVEKLDSKEFKHEDQIRLRSLRELESELGRPLSEAADNDPMLIPECEWETYCREMAEDCGYISRGRRADHNPLMDHIDWSSWADAVAQDYHAVMFDGMCYYTSSY